MKSIFCETEMRYNSDATDERSGYFRNALTGEMKFAIVILEVSLTLSLTLS